MQVGELTLTQIIETFDNDNTIELTPQLSDSMFAELPSETLEIIDSWLNIHDGGTSALGILMLVKRYGFPIDIWEAFEKVGI